jgi:hypothetical protein
MYSIVKIVVENSELYVVCERLSKKELASFSTYADAAVFLRSLR